MSNIKNPQRFAELEYSLQKYFDGKVASVMSSVKSDLSNKQIKEIKDYRSSFAGMMSMANFDKAGDTTMATLKLTGKWNSKTVEDYVAMCQKKLQNDKGFQKDLITLAAEWRNAVVSQVGRARYDQLSQQLGGDLAYAYVATRMDDLMMQKLVKDNMPKSTADYIIRKAAQGSIWGLEQELSKSPLAREIEAKGEKAFKPSKGAKVAGKLGSSVIDAATLSVGSWKSFATYVGGDVLFNALFKGKTASEQKEMAVEAAISKGVFGSNTNVFTGFRQQTKSLQGKDNTYLNSLNSKLNHKITVPFKPFMDFNLLDTSKTAWKPTAIPGLQQPPDRSQGKYKDVPLLVAPGKEDEYLAFKEKYEVQKAKRQEQEASKAKTETPKKVETPKQETQSATNNSQGNTNSEQSQSSTTDIAKTPSSTTTGNIWEQLSQASGMDGFGSVLGNAGYVVSMLPDILIGLFTGKTQSLNLKSSMMPLAAILAGMFVRNPFLKFALIAMGGLNLFNKAGKETLEWQHQRPGETNGQSNQQPQYRQYADEPLNPRITNPVLQGTTLIANIDRVPCNIQLTQNVVGAYQAGALPLNTLANAVLVRYDATAQTAQQQYGQMAQQTITQNQSETIHRSR